jgi:hypothetical protein
MTDKPPRYDLKPTLRAAMEAAYGDYDPDAVIAWLARHGFAIVRDPEHAAEAVEAADLAFSDEPWLVPAKEAMVVAITAYIEAARK